MRFLKDKINKAQNKRKKTGGSGLFWDNINNSENYAVRMTSKAKTMICNASIRRLIKNCYTFKACLGYILRSGSFLRFTVIIHKYEIQLMTYWSCGWSQEALEQCRWQALLFPVYKNLMTRPLLLGAPHLSHRTLKNQASTDWKLPLAC